MTRHFARRVLQWTACAILGPVVSSAPAADWPQFLGLDRNGISAERGLVDTFPADGPKLVWRVEGGIGMSGIVVSGGKALTTVQTDGKEQLTALDAATGQTLWRSPIGAAFENTMGPGTRATPTVADDRVFVFTGDGVLAAFNLADGKPLWSQNLPQQFNGAIVDYGMACSPLVVGDRVIVMIGAPNATVVACNVADGKVAWQAANDAAGYSSPALLDVGGRRQLVVVTGSSVLGLSPDDGAVLWRHEYLTDFFCNTATPVAYDGMVFVSSGENHGCVMLKLTPSGDKFEVAEAWSSQGTESVLRAEWQTPLVLNGHLYGFDNLGGAGPITHLTCVDAKTGRRLWQQARFGKGNAVAADGKLWISTLAGELVLVKATPSGYEELARADVGVATRQAPSLADGRLYLRDGEHVYCFDVRK